MPQDLTNFARLLYPCGTDVFLRDYLEKKCLHVSGNKYVRSLLSIETMEHILNTVRLPGDALTIIDSGDHEQVLTKAGLVDPEQARTAWHAGKTLIFNGLHKFWQPLTTLCRQLETELHLPVQTNIYMTPPKAQGFKAHVDTHDVFIVQAEGKKHWRVYSDPVYLPYHNEKYTAKDLPENFGTPVIDTVLEQGDVLYIPRGWIHEAETVAERSLHITIGLLSYTWRDYLHQLIDKMGAENRTFRQSLPEDFLSGAMPPSKRNKLVEKYLNTASAGAIDASRQAMLEKLVSSHILPAGAGLTLSGEEAKAALTDVYEKWPDLPIYIVQENQDISVLFAGKKITFPFFIEPALSFIINSPSFTRQDLPANLDTDEKTVLLKRLIREGLIRRLP